MVISPDVSLDDLLAELGPYETDTDDYTRYFTGLGLPWSVEPEHRREAFMRTINDFLFMFQRVQAVFDFGAGWVISIAYFLVYHFLYMLNRRRGGFLDTDLIHRTTVFILNNCAAGDFGPLYDYLFV